MVDCVDGLLPTYEANPVISEAVSNILHSSDLTSLSALVSQCDGKRAKEQRVKRPMNAFMLYAQVARRKVATKYPNLNYAKLSKTLGKIWQVLPENERRPFIQEAERLRAQHKLKHPGYKYTPKRTKEKKSHGMAKKVQYENLKPEELMNILQTKRDPSIIQDSKNFTAVPMRSGSLGSDGNSPLGSPVNFQDPLRGQSLGQDSSNCNTLTSMRNPIDADSQTFDHLEPSAHSLSRTGSGFPSIHGSDLRWLFSDQVSRGSYPNVNHLLDTYSNPNLFISDKTNHTLPPSQPLSLFTGQDPSSAFSSHGTLNPFDGMEFSPLTSLKQKTMDPMNNINHFFDGNTHLSSYLTM